MRIVAVIAALIAIAVVGWFLSLLVEADNFTRSEWGRLTESEWGVDYQVKFSEAFRAVWRIEIENLTAFLDALLVRFGLTEG